MNDIVNKKPIDAKVRETALRIMERAMFYNATRTQKKFTGSKPTFFVDFLGHICTLEASVHVSGYCGSDCEYLTSFAGIRLYEENALPQLESVLKRMEEIYTDWYAKEHENE